MQNFPDTVAQERTGPCPGLLDVLLARLLKAAQLCPRRPGCSARWQAAQRLMASSRLELIVHKDVQPCACHLSEATSQPLHHMMSTSPAAYS